MAVDLKPGAMFAGYSSDETTISIPISALARLTIDEAHAKSGDYRAILLSLCSRLRTKYVELPIGDRPTNFVSKQPSEYSLTPFVDTTRKTYPFSITETSVLSEPEVADEQ